MLGIVEALRPVEREMIPDIRPTVDALAAARRVGGDDVASARRDVSGASLGSLDARIASLRHGTGDAGARTAAVVAAAPALVAARVLGRRQSLANQLESAGLMLQNLKLDLLKLRSSALVRRSRT